MAAAGGSRQAHVFVNGSADYAWVVGDLTYVGSGTAIPSDSEYRTFDAEGVWADGPEP